MAKALASGKKTRLAGEKQIANEGSITGYEPQSKPWTLIRGKPRGMDPARFN
jgi:hypothetical protein